jgi:uncharacterized iron-regulated membrane protein
MSARRLLTWLHAWLGAVSAVFVILIAGSGVLLAWMSELFMAEYGDMLRAKPPAADAPYASLDAMMANAGAGYGEGFNYIGVLMPHSRVQGIETAMLYGLPEGKTGFEDTWMLSVDPWTAAYKGDFRLDDAFGHQVIHFHHQLFAGDAGAVFVSILGLLLVAFALTGLWLWWPRNGSAWRKASRLSLSGGTKRAWFNLHGWSGVWAALAIVFFSITGTATAKPDWFGPLLSDAPETPPAGTGFEATCDGRVSPGAALLAAEAAHPGRRAASMLFPFEPGHPYQAMLKAKGDGDTINGDMLVFVHATCPGVIHSVDLSTGPVGQKLQGMMLSLHGGYTFGQTLGDILVVATGLVLVLLSVSGLVVFVTRTLRLGGPGRAPAEEAGAQEAVSPAE